ncbi:thiol-disulfide oxidoreductase DCC family protein [Methylobacterium sp. M6A4_1b]
MLASQTATPSLTVYFDGACPLCAAEIRAYRRSDGAERVAWVDVGIEDPALGPDLTLGAARARFHVRRPDGTLASGAAGFAALWAVLPRWHILARFARLPGVLGLGEVAYRLFVPLRPWIARFVRGGGPSCDKACG